MVWRFRRFRRLAVSAAFSTAAAFAQAPAQAPTSAQPAVAGGSAAPITTLKLNSQLVVLDITVVDKKGHPVTSGLKKDDFFITENKQPERIFSFEPPQGHAAPAVETDDGSFGNAPATIFVLDEFNNTFEQNGSYRSALRKYLESQPATLASPAELMVVSTYFATEIVQGFTRSRDDLVSALDHVPSELPSPNIDGTERFRKTFGALDGIALENMGASGRKNVMWLGNGIALPMKELRDRTRAAVNEYMRHLTNTLVAGRVTLHMIHPPADGMPHISVFGDSQRQAREIDVKDPFGEYINFNLLAHETGGAIFYNNFTEQEIGKALDYGNNYYTLSYQPQSNAMDSKFRRIRVTMRDPDLQAVTKTGYYSPDPRETTDPQRLASFQVAEAAQSSLPFDELHVAVDHVVRHPDAGTAEFSLHITPKNIPWVNDEAGTSSTTLGVTAISLAQRGAVLAYRARSSTFRTATQDAAVLGRSNVSTSITLPVSRKTNHVRIVIRAMDTGRMGAVDISRQVIDAAPEAPSPEPVIPALQQHTTLQTPATN